MSLKLSKKAFIFVIVFVINILLTVKLWTDQASFALLAVIVGVTFLLLWSLRKTRKPSITGNGLGLFWRLFL